MQNRTYRYFKGKALYSFGYGLSYTKFSYSHLKLSTGTLHAGDMLIAEADVRNTGREAGDEVAELYLMPPHDGNGGLSPNLQLEGFQRFHLAPGQIRHVIFRLDSRAIGLRLAALSPTTLALPSPPRQQASPSRERRSFRTDRASVSLNERLQYLACF